MLYVLYFRACMAELETAIEAEGEKEEAEGEKEADRLSSEANPDLEITIQNDLNSRSNNQRIKGRFENFCIDFLCERAVMPTKKIEFITVSHTQSDVHINKMAFTSFFYLVGDGWGESRPIPSPGTFKIEKTIQYKKVHTALEVFTKLQ